MGGVESSPEEKPAEDPPAKEWKRRYFGQIDDALFGKDTGKKVENTKNKKSKNVKSKTDVTQTNNPTRMNTIAQSLKLDLSEDVCIGSSVDGASRAQRSSDSEDLKTKQVTCLPDSKSSYERYRTAPSSPVNVQNRHDTRSSTNSSVKCKTVPTKKTCQEETCGLKQAVTQKDSPVPAVNAAQRMNKRTLSATAESSGPGSSTAAVAVNHLTTEGNDRDSTQTGPKSSLKTAALSKQIYNTTEGSHTAACEKQHCKSSLPPSKHTPTVIERAKDKQRVQTKSSKEVATPSKPNQSETDLNKCKCKEQIKIISSVVNTCDSKNQPNSSSDNARSKHGHRDQTKSSQQNITPLSKPNRKEQTKASLVNSAPTSKVSDRKVNHLEMLSLDLDLPAPSTPLNQPDEACTRSPSSGDQKRVLLAEQQAIKQDMEKIQEQYDHMVHKVQQQKLRGAQEIARLKRRESFDKQRVLAEKQNLAEQKKENDRLRQELKQKEDQWKKRLTPSKQLVKNKAKQNNDPNTKAFETSCKSGTKAQESNIKQGNQTKKFLKKTPKSDTRKQVSSASEASKKQQTVSGTGNFIKINHKTKPRDTPGMNTNREIESTSQQLHSVVVKPPIISKVHTLSKDSACPKQNPIEIRNVTHSPQTNQTQQEHQQHDQKQQQPASTKRQQLQPAANTTETIKTPATNREDPAKVATSKKTSTPKSMRWLSTTQTGIVPVHVGLAELQKTGMKKITKQPTLKSQLFSNPAAASQKQTKPLTTCILHDDADDVIAIQQLPKTAVNHLSDVRNLQSRKATDMAPRATKISRPLQLGQVPVCFLMKEHCEEYTFGFPEEDEEYENLRVELDNTFFLAKLLGWDAFQGSLYHFYREEVIVRPTEFPRLTSCTKRVKSKTKAVSEASVDATKLTKKQRKRLARSKAKMEREKIGNETRLKSLLLGDPVTHNLGNKTGAVVSSAEVTDVSNWDGEKPLAKGSSELLGIKSSKTSSTSKLRSPTSDKHADIVKPITEAESKHATAEKVISSKPQSCSKRLTNAIMADDIRSALTQNQQLADRLACAGKRLEQQTHADIVKPITEAESKHATAEKVISSKPQSCSKRLTNAIIADDIRSALTQNQQIADRLACAGKRLEQQTGLTQQKPKGQVANAVQKLEAVEDNFALLTLNENEGYLGVSDVKSDTNDIQQKVVKGSSLTKRLLPEGKTSELKSKGSQPPQNTSASLLATGDASTSLHSATDRGKMGTAANVNLTVTVRLNAHGIPCAASVSQISGAKRSTTGQLPNTHSGGQKQPASSNASKIPKDAKFTPGVAGPPIRKNKNRKRPETRRLGDLTIAEVEESHKEMKKTFDKVTTDFDKLSLESGKHLPKNDTKILVSKDATQPVPSSTGDRTHKPPTSDPTPNSRRAPRPTTKTVEKSVRRLVFNQYGKRKLTVRRRIHTLTNTKLSLTNLDDIRFCRACADSKQPDGKPLIRCTKCEDVFYCSRQCLTNDWDDHRYNCKGYRSKCNRCHTFQKKILTAPPQA